MSRIQFAHTYNDIISVDNLLAAWREFENDKRNKKDVQEFSINLMDNIIQLHDDLAAGRYRHGAYVAFNINDPKPRCIHKALVRDRLLHHALYRKLYPFFDRTFIADSFSCRFFKGTHKAMERFRIFGRKVSKNHTKTCWILKCDIRKFFASIDQMILMDILRTYISDEKILVLLLEIIGSFHSIKQGTGLPLGNLTSQLLVNVYMNEFDQFMKHDVKARYYIRYADDFVIFSQNRDFLTSLIPILSDFLRDRLKLSLHPEKVYIKTLASGVDFLGWVHFFDYRVLRTSTKNRMLKNILSQKDPKTSVQSYLGLLSHGNARRLKKRIATHDDTSRF